MAEDPAPENQDEDPEVVIGEDEASDQNESLEETSIPGAKSGMDPDRIFGAIFGAALGNCLGSLAKGKDRKLLSQKYPPDGRGLKFPTGDPAPQRWWSYATDSIVLTMRTITEAKNAPPGGPSVVGMAQRLIGWSNSGFQELGDRAGEGCDGLTWRVVRDEKYIENPIEAAKAVLGPKANNGAITRGIPCAFAVSPEEWALMMSAVTHVNPRSLACIVAFTNLIRGLAKWPANMKLDYKLFTVSLSRGFSVAKGLTLPMRREIVSKATHSVKIEDIGLDDRDERSIISRTLACAVWAFRQLIRAKLHLRNSGSNSALFESCLRQVAAQGGDADFNCAVVGAVLGAMLGYDGFKSVFDNLTPPGAARDKKWLTREIARFTAVIPLARTLEIAKPAVEPVHIDSAEFSITDEVVDTGEPAADTELGQDDVYDRSAAEAFAVNAAPKDESASPASSESSYEFVPEVTEEQKTEEGFDIDALLSDDPVDQLPANAPAISGARIASQAPLGGLVSPLDGEEPPRMPPRQKGRPQQGGRA